MIILDTNIVSELLRPRPAPAVLDWVAQWPDTTLFITAITEAELRLGVALLPEGRRRDALATAVDAVLVEDFRDRVLPFDSQAARAFAALTAARRAAGRPITQADAQIAAIALARGAPLATRNLRDFDGLGLVLLDPWAPPSPPTLPPSAR